MRQQCCAFCGNKYDAEQVTNGERISHSYKVHGLLGGFCSALCAYRAANQRLLELSSAAGASTGQPFKPSATGDSK